MSVIEDQASRLRSLAHSGAAAAGMHRTLQVTMCSCGLTWRITRTELPHVVSEYMTCLCGEILMSWNEAADYRFEPLEADGL